MVKGSGSTLTLVTIFYRFNSDDRLNWSIEMKNWLDNGIRFWRVKERWLQEARVSIEEVKGQSYSIIVERCEHHGELRRDELKGLKMRYLMYWVNET